MEKRNRRQIAWKGSAVEKRWRNAGAVKKWWSRKW
jgi:hypothetical protein